MTRRMLTLVTALAIVALVVQGAGSVGYAQEPPTWVRGYPEPATENCVWYVAEWSDGSFTNTPWSCHSGFAAQSDGVTALRSYPEEGTDGCVWYVTQWDDGTFSRVPFQCPAGATAAKTGMLQPAAEKTVAVPPPVATAPPIAERPPFTAVSVRYGPNCAITRAIVNLQDSAGRFVNGAVFRLESPDGTWGANSYSTGSEGYTPGTTDFTLPPADEDRTWNLFVLDGAGQKVSSAFQFTTQANGVDCNWDGQGRQVAWITFQEYQATAGVATGDEGLAFRFAGMDWDQPNCGMTRIIIYARDPAGVPIDGVRFHVEAAGGGWGADSYPTGQDDLADGQTDFFLRPAALAGTWRVWSIDAAGNRISPVAEVTTDDLSCEPGGTGHQIARLVFVRK